MLDIGLILILDQKNYFRLYVLFPERLVWNESHMSSVLWPLQSLGFNSDGLAGMHIIRLAN